MTSDVLSDPKRACVRYLQGDDCRLGEPQAAVAVDTMRSGGDVSLGVVGANRLIAHDNAPHESAGLVHDCRISGAPRSPAGVDQLLHEEWKVPI